MPTDIKEIDAENYEVNGKPVYKDGNGQWIASLPLEADEAKTFNLHLNRLKHQKTKVPPSYN